MPATRRSGSRVRSLPDWYSSDLVGVYATVIACPGHFQSFGIYNNATDGSLLKVYSIDAFNAATTGFLLFTQLYGQAFAVSVTSFGSIDPLVSAPWGIPIQGGGAVLLGKVVGAMMLQSGVPRTYAPGWPIAIVQPGYSWFIQQNNSGQELDASIFYLVTAS